MAERPSFFAELKRRNVPRAAVLYAGAVWALAQGIAQLGPLFDAPNWAMRGFVIVCAIGFPFWVAFAWFYAWTPQGFKRESEVEHDAATKHSTGRKLDFAIIGVMAVAIVLLASGYFVRRQPVATTVARPAGAAASAAPKPTPFNPPKDTLVVLPFKNLAGDKSQQYFSDGITEELTDALGQNAALRVTAWETASTLRDPELTARDVGEKLNVANILNGSIAHEGNEVRVTAELVNTVTGQQLWSHHYDESFSDIFKVQDQVSQAIAQALQVKFAQADLPQAGTSNPQAHDLVLKGRALLDKLDAASIAAAPRDFEAAIALDPDYADAHALLAHALLDLARTSDLSLKATLPQIRAEAEKALALDPKNVDAWVALGNADASTDPPDFAMAETELRKALALDPSNAAAHIGYGNVLPLKPGLAEYQEVTRLDPDNAIAWNNLAADELDLGDWSHMITASQALIRLDPADVDSAFNLAYAYQQQHQYAKVVAAFDLVKPGNAVDQEQVATGRLVYRAVVDPKLRPQALAALKSLSRHQSNPDVAGNLIGMYASLGEHGAVLQGLETYCPDQPVDCSDLAVNPVYTALRADPRFQKLVKRYNTMTVQ